MRSGPFICDSLIEAFSRLSCHPSLSLCCSVLDCSVAGSAAAEQHPASALADPPDGSAAEEPAFPGADTLAAAAEA